jgi:maleylpyruvate isomerase
MLKFGTETAGSIMESDPAQLQRQVDEATARLLDTAGTLTDDRARAPSLLPGWTCGHVLTHVARNADGLRNLLVWARTGVERPQYASAEARNDDIEAGAHRTASKLVADVRDSADAFRAEAGRLAGSAWQVPVHGLRGREHPAWYTLVRRLTEVEVHHVDLDAGFGPADWPEEFVDSLLRRTVGGFADRQDVPSCRLEIAGSGETLRIGPSGQDGMPGDARTVAGPAHVLLAWLIGRADGSGLSVRPAGRLPTLPPWS